MLKEDHRKLKQLLREKETTSLHLEPGAVESNNNNLLNYIKDDSLLLREQSAQATLDLTGELHKLKESLLRS